MLTSETRQRASGPVLHPWVLAVFSLIVVAATAWFFDHALGETIAVAALVLGHGTAGFLTLRKTRLLEGRERRAWQLVGTGFVLAAGGVLGLALWDTLGQAPAFGPLDVLFLATYVIGLAGLSWLPHLSGDRAQRLRLLLDGLVGGISIGAVLWLTSIQELVAEASDARVFERILATAYPLLDLTVIVVVMIVVVRRSAYRFDPRMLVLAVGIVLQAVADVTFLSTALGRSLQEAEPFYPLFLGSAGCFLAVGVLLDRRPPPREYADRRTALFWMLAPYSAATAMVGFLVAEVSGSDLGPDARFLLATTLAVGCLVVLRQAVAIRENRDLVERQRTALVSSISHELRTPLTAMVGFLSVLDDAEAAAALSPDEREEMLHVVREQAVYLTRIVTDLVMLARGDIDRMQLQVRPVDVAELVLSSLATVDGAADGVVVDVSPNLSATVDPDRVRQVLVNLLSNAARYGGERRIVAARPAGEDLVLEVHDSGPGIPKKYEIVIWERFERGPNRLNAGVPGSGIGLAVVDAIAKAHGGTASYRPSELLGGACFQVILPGAVAADEQPAPPQPVLGGGQRR